MNITLETFYVHKSIYVQAYAKYVQIFNLYRYFILDSRRILSDNFMTNISLQLSPGRSPEAVEGITDSQNRIGEGGFISCIVVL